MGGQPGNTKQARKAQHTLKAGRFWLLGKFSGDIQEGFREKILDRWSEVFSK